MPPTDKQTFIKDPKPGMTIQEKNKLLAQKLSVGPNLNRKIVDIERLEIGHSGWRITYRIGT